MFKQFELTNYRMLLLCSTALLFVCISLLFIPNQSQTLAQTTYTITIPVIDQNDDAEQYTTIGTMDRGSRGLDMFQTGSGIAQTIGLRFQTVGIPAGAVIENAYIEFTSRKDRDSATTMTLHGEAVDSAISFSTTDFDVTNRAKTSTSVTWTVPEWITDQKYQTPSLKAVVQEIVNRAGWSNNNAMAFIASGTGNRVAHAYDSDPEVAPRLIVEFSGVTVTNTPIPTQTPTITPTPLPTATPTPSPTGTLYTIRAQIAIDSDDAEEIATTGDMSIGSSDLDMTETNSGTQMVGLRFPNLTLPKGAVVVNAYIEFTADESDDVMTSLVIHGEHSDNAATFTTDNSSISSRNRTVSSTTWSPVPTWVTSQRYVTPNLAAIVQNIADRAGWQSGNAMAFIVSGTGMRAAISYSKDSAAAARLYITYTGVTPIATYTPTPTETHEGGSLVLPPSPTPTATTIETATNTPTATLVRATATPTVTTVSSGNTPTPTSTPSQTPVPVAEQSVSPESGGTLNGTLSDLFMAVEFEPGTVAEIVTIMLGHQSSPPTIPNTFKALGEIFSITAQTNSGTPVTTFAKPFKISISYNNADVGEIDENRLVLHFWNPNINQWVPLDTMVHPEANLLVVELDHLTTFGIFESTQSIYLPIVSH